MALRRRLGTGWVDPTIIRRAVGGAWVDVATIRRKFGGVWITVWSAFTPVMLAVDGARGIRFDTECERRAVPVAASTTAVASGGASSKTYSWEYRSGDASLQIDDATSPTPRWVATVRKNKTTSAVWRCTVTDGISAAFVDVTVAMSYW